ncbi:three-Cys-motif partner protein TcmP [Rhodococcus hoagii]|nr:three-Cys-motif partner protein TcmP [Prescottella equi]
MADSDPSKWEMPAHTRAKHEILTHYLGAWYPILSSWRGRILYIDGFAGRGRYNDGSEGSPQIALRRLLEHSFFKRMDCEFVFIFIEKNRRNAENLELELKTLEGEYDPWPSNVRWQVVNESFDTQMQELIDAVKAQNRQLAPTFAFIDPFGYTRFPMALLSELARTPNSELFINFMVGFVQRFIERDGQQASMRALYGKDVAEVLEGFEEGGSRIDHLCDVYADTLRESTGLQYIQRFFMLNWTGNVSYALIHATSNQTAMSRMKDAMWKVDPGGSYTFSDRTGDSPVLFVPDPDLTPLMTAILEHFLGRTFVTAEEVRSFAVLETSFRAPHATEVLKQFEREGVITVTRPKGARQFGSGVTFDFPATPF